MSIASGTQAGGEEEADSPSGEVDAGRAGGVEDRGFDGGGVAEEGGLV